MEEWTEGYYDIFTAVNRWRVTASKKSKVLNSVLDYAGTNISYDKSKELLASRIRAKQNHLSKRVFTRLFSHHREIHAGVT